jgi:EpsI family protein
MNKAKLHRNNRYWILIVITVGFGVLVWNANYAETIPNDNLFKFPLKIGDWSGNEIKMDDWVYRSLETPYAIMRDYTNSAGSKTNLAIVWYDDKEVAFHTPEACLGSLGNYVREKTYVNYKIDPQNLIKIARLIVDDGRDKKNVYYFYFNDGFVTYNQTILRLKVFLKRIRLQRTSAAFIRIIVPFNSDKKYAENEVKKFLINFYPKFIEYLKTPSI